MIACPRCGAETTVSETRSSGKVLRRRRVCSNIACNARTTTIEVIAATGQYKRYDGPMTMVPIADLRAIRDLLDALLDPVDEAPTGSTWTRIAKVGEALGDVLL